MLAAGAVPGVEYHLDVAEKHISEATTGCRAERVVGQQGGTAAPAAAEDLSQMEA